MRVIVFGATGMVGQGVLRECLRAPDVERVLAVGRRATGLASDKLEELVHRDLEDLSSVEARLAGYDACLFCLGVSAAGLDEAAYRKITYDYTLAVARTLARLDPGMTFVYVSGQGTDASERGPAMWARVKGETENALLRLPFKAAYLFRPGFIRPGPGIVSRTWHYRLLYAVMSPLFPLMRALAPSLVTTSEQLGRAMLQVCRAGAPQRRLETPAINALGA